MTDFTARREKLSDAKRALLEKRLRGANISETAESQGSAALPALTPNLEERHVPFPLTEMQRLCWIGRGGDWELGNVSAHVYTETERTDLDLERFAQTWRFLVQRHEMLRAVIRPDGQQQILAEVAPYEIEVLDLRGKPAEEAERELAAIRERMSHQVRPSHQWPLFEIRASLLDDRRTRLHVSFDLLILDLPSIEFLILQWRKLYDNPETALPPLELSFRDYVLAEQAFRDTDLYRRSLKYWQDRVAQLPPGPDLPLARPARSVERPRFVQHERKLARDAWDRIKARATPEGLTPSGVLLTAFTDVLTGWSRSRRFTVGSTLFNRLPLNPRINDVLGQFTSSSLLEVDNTEADTFLARAQRHQKQLWKDLEYGYVNALHLLREKAVAEGRGTQAVAPVVFTSALAHFEEAGNVPPIHWLGERKHCVCQTPQVWLDHQALEDAGTLVLTWDVVAELFPPGQIEERFETYLRLLLRLANEKDIWQATVEQACRP